MKRTNERGVRLKSNASGTDDRRFSNAMKQHTAWVKEEGSKYAGHVCSVCTEVEDVPNSDKQTGQILPSSTINEIACRLTNTIS